MTTVTTVNKDYIPSFMLDENGNIKPEYQEEAVSISKGVSTIIAEMPPVDRTIFLLTLYDSFVTDSALYEDVSTIDGALEALEEAAVAIGQAFANSGGFKSIAAIIAEVVMLLELEFVDERLRSKELSLELMQYQKEELKKQGKEGLEGSEKAFTANIFCSGATAASAGLTAYSGYKEMSTVSKGTTLADTGNSSKQIQQGQDPNNVSNVEELNQLKVSNETALENQKTVNHKASAWGHAAGAIKSGGDISQSVGQSSSSLVQAQSQREVKEMEGDEAQWSAHSSYENTQSDTEKQMSENLAKMEDVMIKALDTENENEIAQMQSVTASM